MQKLITLSDEQYAAAEEAMKAFRLRSLSQLLNSLLLFYEQNQKRSVGRPRKDDGEDDVADDERIYQNPDQKYAQVGYSKNDLEAYYGSRNMEVPPEAYTRLLKDLNK